MAEYEESLKQREKEVELAVYFAKAFIEEIGKKRAFEIIKKAWSKSWADSTLKQLAGVPQKDRLKAFGEYLQRLTADMPELKIIEATPKRLRIEVRRCVSYDAFKNLGAPEVCQMYCDSDYLSAPLIHPKVKLIRDKVIAYGADYCNHCWIMED